MPDLSQEKPAASRQSAHSFQPVEQLSVQLSEHFVIDEFEFSQVAVRRGIDNRVPDIKLPNVRHLVTSVLQPLRHRLGLPIVVTSGYRCARLNREVAGSRNSAHTLGLAADVWVGDLSPYELTAHIADSGLPFDVVVNEFGRWTHIQAPRVDELPRRDVLTAHKLGNNHTRFATGNLVVSESRALV